MFKNLTFGLFALIVGLAGAAFTNIAEAEVSNTADCLLPTTNVGIVTCVKAQKTQTQAVPVNVSLPDVVITSLNYDKDNQTFKVIVKNQGKVATPANQVIGVGYFVNGTHRTWGSFATSLAPGASITIGTSLTGDKAGRYAIPNGTHTIKAWVDDVNRFAEADEKNNELSQVITISDQANSNLPDVVVTALNYNQNTHTFSAVVKNQGKVATPADKVIGVGYFVDGIQRTWGNVTSPLAAGASVTIGTSLLGAQAGPYTIANGTHNIRAWVDDVNRFPEANENNNDLTKAITIGSVTTNVPPTITGTPATKVTKSTAYNFTPKATDTNGDTLNFAIQNKPTWATFNVTTGRLSGTPTALGTHSNIRISVTDGKSAVVFLPAFSIEVVGGSVVPPVTGKKYNPGHYVTLSHGNSLRLDDTTNKNDGPVFVQELKNTGVKGMVVRYPWKEFEPTQGNYNYTRVKKHLDLAQTQGLKMIVFVDDKSFDGGATVPDYIKNNKNYVFGNKTGGVSAARWNPFVSSRFIALWKDMGAEIDNHPALEGVVYSETALSIPTGTVTTPAYDPVVNKQVIINTLTAQSEAFPKSNVFWMMNFIPSGYHNGQFLGNKIVDEFIGDIADTVLPLDVIIGGPDILPENDSLVSRTYPYYDEFNAKGMRLFNSAQNDSYRHLHNGNTKLPFYTLKQIHDYGKNELHVNYIWWNYKTWIDPGVINKDGARIPSGEYVWDDAAPVIKANPVINSD